MIFKIHNRWDNSVMFEVEADSFAKAVEAKRANLCDANLRDADLCDANLRDANLCDADLCGADLTKTHYQVSQILHNYNWGILPDNLTLELMRRDAVICGDDKMQTWADGGECPFKGYIERDFFFSENRALWKSGAPTMNDMELFKALCKERGIRI